jgi:hypothetical protein
MRALSTFGVPTNAVTEDDFAVPGITFQIGVEPVRIDIMTDIDGLTFDEAWANRFASEYGGEPVFVILAQISSATSGRRDDHKTSWTSRRWNIAANLTDDTRGPGRSVTATRPATSFSMRSPVTTAAPLWGTPGLSPCRTSPVCTKKDSTRIQERGSGRGRRTSLPFSNELDRRTLRRDVT